MVVKFSLGPECGCLHSMCVSVSNELPSQREAESRRSMGQITEYLQFQVHGHNVAFQRKTEVWEQTGEKARLGGLTCSTLEEVHVAGSCSKH